jgi:hypothetical protein
VKVHVTVEVIEFMVLDYDLTDSNVHDSEKFVSVWDKLPPNASQKLSGAD